MKSISIITTGTGLRFVVAISLLINFASGISCFGNQPFEIDSRHAKTASLKFKITEIAYVGIIINILDHKFNKPAGLGMDQEGNLFIADEGGDSIYMRSTEGEILLVSDKYTAPRCILSLPDGRMMVSTDHKGGMLLIISPIR